MGDRAANLDLCLALIAFSSKAKVWQQLKNIGNTLCEQTKQ
jgi:hypothetical protein